MALIHATRNHHLIALGVSPRGTLALTRMAQARAFLHGFHYVRPEDVHSVFCDVCTHRILISSKARISKVSAYSILKEILAATPSPSVRSRH